ncbi:hypothetical protein RAJCM14343_1419 [Rhodococcus aetherivorans]|uniref:Uncharacterized protein n=1 Tax=Rhodococcus aetherivorans TaxID=191292 RepID=A0ABQ0YI82_9NOCA|nr:hypothetical protein RAJCM14343_1419 [Rhodococcus aetherivorans]
MYTDVTGVGVVKGASGRIETEPCPRTVPEPPPVAPTPAAAAGPGNRC